jgi:fructose-1-phosphate kinase PfkB-like protein
MNMSAPLMVVGPNTARDEVNGHPYVLGGGAANTGRAFNCVANYLRLGNTTPQIIGFGGQTDSIPTLPHNPPGLHLVPVDGETRVNRIWWATDGQHEEHGQSTLRITPSDVDRMMEIMIRARRRKFWQSRPWVALTGSLPEGMDAQFYANSIEVLQGLGGRVLLDTRPDSLRVVLNSGFLPDIIKPNQAELEQLIGESIDPLDDLRTLEQTKGLIPRGILVLSLGQKGILARRGKRAWHITASLPPGYGCTTTIGCGDSVGGAMLAGLSRSPHNIPRAVKLGAAAGTANTTTEVPGEFPPGLFEQIMRKHTTVERVT